jgi:hypothetical protein
MRNRDRFIILLIALTVTMLIAALVEPCDGHSCDAEVTHGGR